MLKIKFEHKGDEIQVKLVPKNLDERQKINDLLADIDVENPVLTYIENPMEYNLATTNVNSLEYYCGKSGWKAKGGMMYSKVNALVVLQNVLTKLLQLKIINKKLSESTVTKKIYFTPCFDFEDDSIEFFSLKYSLDFDKKILTECVIECNHMFTCGKDLTDHEQKFVEMIWKGQEEISVWDLINILIEKLWEYYNT